jgi:trehalose 6-phosphate phosphatase
VLAGSYGRERSNRPDAFATRDWEPVVTTAIEGTDGWSGVIVERKGAGVALHYRLAPERATDVARLASAVAREFALEVRPGRMVAELVEPGPGKAEALRDFTSERDLDTFLFAGDDVADAEAFEWARASGRTCVLVGVRSAESPEAIERDADVVVNGPAEFVAVLEEVVSRVDQTGS